MSLYHYHLQTHKNLYLDKYKNLEILELKECSRACLTISNNHLKNLYIEFDYNTENNTIISGLQDPL